MKLAALKLAGVGIAALLATTGVASAHDSWSIDGVQAQQRQRIIHGRQTGQLTWREYRALMAEQRHIAHMERLAKSDGFVSRREYRAIREAQREAGRHIRAEKHDGQVSFWRGLRNRRYD